MNAQSSITLSVGETENFEVHGYDINGVDLGVVAASETNGDPSVDTVKDNGDGTGSITGVAAGTDTVLATTKAGLQASLSVTVGSAPQVASIGFVFPFASKTGG